MNPDALGGAVLRTGSKGSKIEAIKSSEGSLDSKMNALLEDDSPRREMGERARENIVRKFILERSTTRLLEEVEF